MLNKIGIHNLRSFTTQQECELRSVNIFVGKNNCGKSSFARILPLIRQSCETKTKGPILWWGKYVDFGNISNSLNSNSSSNSISFSFDLDAPLAINNRDLHSGLYSFLNKAPSTSKTTPINIKITVKKIDDHTTIFSNLSLKIYNSECNLKFTDGGQLESLSVNEFLWRPNSTITTITSLKLLPSIAFHTKKKISDTEYIFIQHNELLSELVRYLKTQVHGNTSQQALSKIATHMQTGSDDDIINYIRHIPDIPKSLANNPSLQNTRTQEFKNLRNRIFASNIINLIESLDSALYRYFLGVKYIAPIRATAERYYRFSDLAINEIDPRGENIAMYLNSLKGHEKRDLKKWMMDNLDIHVDTHESQGHIAIEISDTKLTNPTNIVDLGFGYSQLLPIALHLWVSTREANNRTGIPPSCLVIEQPELHLHPEMQAKLGNLFVNFANDQNIIAAKTKLIIETHSPHLINKIGELVYDGKIAQSNVRVFLFEKDHNNSTTISASTYNAEGILTNWPIGFLSA